MSFYIGYRLISLISPKQLLKIIEISLLFIIFLGILLYNYPIELLMHPRVTGLQGTFVESTGFGIEVGLLLLISLTMRYDSQLIPSIKKYFLIIVLSIGSILFSKVKAFWFGIGIVFISYLLFKLIFPIIKYRNFSEFKALIKNYSKLLALNIKTIIITFVLLGAVLFIANNTMEKPIITVEQIRGKMESERGKAFHEAVSLISQNWVNGYGFGFVEVYFNTHQKDILGLGGNVGMIFNSYLDAWISVGVLGVLFHIILLLLAFSPRYTLTFVIPIYLFALANVHPLIGGENYYLFLGLSYGFKKYMENREIENA